jgi:hypothetical protein
MAMASFLIARADNGSAAPVDPQKSERLNICALQLGVFASHMGGFGGYCERMASRCGFGVEMLFGASILRIATDSDINTIQLIPGFRFTYALSRSKKSECLLGAAIYPIPLGDGLISWIYWTPFFEIRSRKPGGFNFRLGMVSLSFGYTHRF